MSETSFKLVANEKGGKRRSTAKILAVLIISAFMSIAAFTSFAAPANGQMPIEKQPDGLSLKEKEGMPQEAPPKDRQSTGKSLEEGQSKEVLLKGGQTPENGESGKVATPLEKPADKPAVKAAPAKSTILVDKKKVAFDAYLIDGNNYFKLRDLAYVLNGTKKQFEITWDAARNAIVIQTGRKYTKVGGEMTVSGSKAAKDAKPAELLILIDGKKCTFTVYTIGGYNYLKLRDLADKINFGVTWDSTAKTVGIDTSIAYSPEGGKKKADASNTGKNRDISGNSTPAQKKTAVVPDIAAGGRVLPEFVFAVRHYAGSGYDEFQIDALIDMGVEYIHGIRGLSWGNVESRRGVFKWNETDAFMRLLEEKGLKVIPTLLLEKQGLEWLPRDDPETPARFAEYCRRVVERYKDSPAWSGIISLWGSSADVPAGGASSGVILNYPEPVINTINTAYEAIKAADPTTIVAAINMGPELGEAPYGGREGWERWCLEAFSLNPRFDWYGIDAYGGYPTDTQETYTGALGLIENRRLLDENGFSSKPVFVSEMGYSFGEDTGGEPEQRHAELIIENLIVYRTLNIRLKGWACFDLFAKSHGPDVEDYGLMTPLDNPSDPGTPRPRQAYNAIKTLLKTVKFLDFSYSGTLSGRYSQPDPFIFEFQKTVNPKDKLWVVFSPWTYNAEKAPPVERTVRINIAPARTATITTMLGTTSELSADGSGNISVTSTSSPVYIRTAGH